MKTHLLKTSQGIALKIDGVVSDKALNWEGPNDKRDYKLKVDKSNQITIIKQKDSWNRDEVINLIRQFSIDVASSSNNNFSTTSNWIEQNL